MNKQEINNYLKLWKEKINPTHFNSFTFIEYKFYCQISKENQYFDIKKFSHYIDDGCLCLDCVERRNILLLQIKNGIKINPNQNVLHDGTKGPTNYKIFIKCHYPYGETIDMIYNVI